jgi:phenylalanine-4-hydroxylase
MRTQDSLPSYLKRYVVPQRYERYTPVEHATWRYIMRRARDFFSRHAVPAYVDGITKTGMHMDRIPKIDEIDSHLQEFGWGAIGVSGFIPPAAFLDFQTRGIMPIAMDMRSLEHVAYTPAPDIVHEAAGHIPILYDPRYRAYLQRYANMANKSIISSEDVRLYEAIRWLSDIKENPDATKEGIDAAGEMLKQAYDGITHVSEMAKVGRMAWWTAEYGLVGDLKSPKIYGAGLLSSVGESEHCLSDKVRKIRLTVECVEQGYDITEPQPQLFVAESLESLPDILGQLEETLSFRRGGSSGLYQALISKAVNTVILESGVSASGILEAYEVDESMGSRVDFIKFKGPVQLAHNEKQLAGQGRDRHAEGFSSPVGYFSFAPSKAPCTLGDDELRAAGIVVGSRCRVDFVSGFKVEGILRKVVREGGKILYMTFADCTVTRGSKRYFEPAWGEFDMIVGSRIASVHGGPAERETYGDYDLGQVSSSPGRTSPFSDHEQEMFKAYTTIREVRGRHVGGMASGNQETGIKDAATLAGLADTVMKKHQGEWLVGLELLELATQRPALVAGNWTAPLREVITAHARGKGELAESLLDRGMELLAVVD